MDRVARKIREGEKVTRESLVGYFYGVAHNILLEYYRKRAKQPIALDDLVPSKHPADDPVQLDLRRQEKMKLERQLECLDTCLQEFPLETRKLIISYYEEELSAKIENRKGLAEALRVSVRALHVRVHRIREKLEKCLFNCLEKQGEV